jgi:hypothetical protein
MSIAWWSYNARRDDDMPGWVPGGSDVDNHECVDYTMSSATYDTGLIDYEYNPPLWFQTKNYNVVLVTYFIPSATKGLGYPPTNPRICLINGGNLPYLFGHEWGHNGGLDDQYTASQYIMYGWYGTFGLNIAVGEPGHWACQTTDPLPATNTGCS